MIDPSCPSLWQVTTKLPATSIATEGERWLLVVYVLTRIPRNGGPAVV